MPIAPTSQFAQNVSALRTAVASRFQAAQAKIQANVAAVRAGVPLPPAPTPAQRAAQAQATIQAARTAGTAAAAHVRAAGGTLAEQSAAAVRAGVQTAQQVVTVQTQARAETLQRQVAAVRENRESMWGGAPWYADWQKRSGGSKPFGSIGFFDWMLGQVKRNGAAYFPEPPTDAPDNAWSSWVQIMYRVFHTTPEIPPVGTPLYAVYRDALNRATHPGGTFGRIAQGIQEGVSKFGNILISIVGAVLAPFTGGASVLAATILTTANRVRTAAVAASSASRANSRAAAAQQAEAQRQAAALQAQVDDFFRNNQAWFAQHGITPQAWVTLTLDQKVEIIRAGSAGQLPVTPPSNPIQGALEGRPVGGSTSAPASSAGSSVSSAPVYRQDAGPSSAGPSASVPGSAPATSSSGGGGTILALLAIPAVAYMASKK